MARATKSLLRTVWRCVISLTISLGIITCSVDGNINRSPIGSNSAGSSIVANGSGTDVPQRSAGYISGPSTLQPVMPRRKLREHSYIAACVLVKNEHRYIREWIRYHLAIGVEKFYFFDHLSTPPIATVLEDYVREGYAEVFYFSGSWEQDSSANLQPSLASMRHASPQAWTYNMCQRTFGFRHTWMANFDVDEFILLKASNSTAMPHLPTFLKAYEPYGGLAMQWQMYGPSGHDQRPQGPTMVEYTKCIPVQNMHHLHDFKFRPIGHMKTITATRCWVGNCGPHRCRLKPGCNYVTEDRNVMSNEVLFERKIDHIRLLHYITRSKEDYMIKASRGSGHSQFNAALRAKNITNRGWHYFDLMRALANETCTEGRRAWEMCCSSAPEI